MHRVRFLDLARQTQAIRPEIDAAIDRVLTSGHYILGDEVRQFEEMFADWIGVAHAVGVSSGYDALRLALLACGVGEGDEVITVANAGVPTVAAIAAVGARPVLADVDEGTMTLDPSRVTERLTSRTRAIVPVHLYGQCADMDGIQVVAERHGLAVVEDCAQAHGARYGGRAAGAIGRVGCFSFYPTKNLGALGDAGMVVTNDSTVAEAVAELRAHGERGERRSVRRSGNSRLDAMQAAVLAAKLPHVDRWNARRRAIAERYQHEFAGLPLRLPGEVPGRTHVYHLFVVRSPERERLRTRLAELGVETLIHYERAVHQHEAWASLDDQAVHLRVTERLVREVISLPLYPEMGDAEVGRVVDAVREAV